MLNSVGRVPSQVSRIQYHRAIVPSGVFRGSEIFSCGLFEGQKLFLVCISWVQNFFFVSISWVQNFFSYVFCGSKFFSGEYVFGPFFLLWPPSLQQDICYVKVYVCVKKSETIILMRNLFRNNLGRNMAYIYSYSSLRYSRVTQEIPTRKYFGLTKYLRNTFGPTKTRWHDATRPTRTTMARDPQN